MSNFIIQFSVKVLLDYIVSELEICIDFTEKQKCSYLQENIFMQYL